MPTCNEAAASILGAEPDYLCDKTYTEVFPEKLREKVAQMILELGDSASSIASSNLSLSGNSGAKHLQLTITKLVGESGAEMGVVVLLDDISELIGAQRMAAWREVARRIAHEIKNPLTPIQLNAQRMQRKLGISDSETSLLPAQILRKVDREMIKDSTAVIIRQVEILRNLVNEFSQFARMPKAQLEVSDIEKVVKDSVRFFQDAHPEISFNVECLRELPEFPLDKEQMSRVLVNLLDNSVAAINVAIERGVEINKGSISVGLDYHESLSLVTLCVTDNGIGVAQEDKSRLFEPYFSTKRSGTGLGLAIVSAIVADHSGYIRVHDNNPHGAKFVIELPIVAEARRLQVR